MYLAPFDLDRSFDADTLARPREVSELKPIGAKGQHVFASRLTPFIDTAIAADVVSFIHPKHGIDSTRSHSSLVPFLGAKPEIIQ